MQQIRGAVLKSRLAFVKGRFGDDAVRRVLATLPAADRGKLASILTIGWYPFDLGRSLDEAIVAVCGNGDIALFRELGASSAARNLSSLQKSFVTPGDPHAFLGKARVIYALYYETGRREYERTGERSGVLTTYEANTFSVHDCQTVIGWYEKALEMCGATDVRIVEEECRATGGTTCRYAVSWSA